MSKLKSKSSAKKRFSVTGRGKLRRRAAFHRHNLTKRTKKVKRNQRGSQTLSAFGCGDCAAVPALSLSAAEDSSWHG